MPFFAIAHCQNAILQANHLAPSDRDVVKKAETMLAQTDVDGKGTMTYDDLNSTAKKFPNLMFPSYILGDSKPNVIGSVTNPLSRALAVLSPSNSKMSSNLHPARGAVMSAPEASGLGGFQQNTEPLPGQT